MLLHYWLYVCTVVINNHFLLHVFCFDVIFLPMAWKILGVANLIMCPSFFAMYVGLFDLVGDSDSDLLRYLWRQPPTTSTLSACRI